MNNPKSILSIDSAIISSLAPAGTFLHTCLMNSKWDDFPRNTSSLAHYNLRLAISKLLQLIKNDEEVHQALIYLLTSNPKIITTNDLIQGYKSIELTLINSFPLNIAKSYSTSVRRFFKLFGPSIASDFKIADLSYESLLSPKIQFKKNHDIEIFTIKIKGDAKFCNIDPDTFPSLFTKHSVLHHLILNLESFSKEKPFHYSIIANLKALLRDITHWNDSSILKTFLNQQLEEVTKKDVLDALLDFERTLSAFSPYKKLNRVSVFFRRILFNFGFTDPELIEAKSEFKTNFNCEGKLNFKPTYIIKCLDSDQVIDSFKLPSVLSLTSLGESCLSAFERNSAINAAESSNVKSLVETLTLLQQSNYSHAKLLLTKSPQDIKSNHISTGLTELESLIKKHFPNDKQEKLQVIRDFLNLCEIPTKNGLLIKEFNVDSTIIPKAKTEVMRFNGYTKVNGKKHGVIVEFNLTKLKPLLKPNGVLTTSLNNLQNDTCTTPMNSVTLTDIERTLGYIVNTSLKADQVKFILTSQLLDLEQRDFRLGFAQFEDIIDEQEIILKAPRSQTFRTFLSKYSGKINGIIEIKNCGFNSRFCASKETNAQKLIEPVDENGDVLPSPVLNPQQSLSELRKNIQEYFEKPINQILDACRKEIQCYKKLVTTFNIYTEKDAQHSYIVNIPDEVSALVKDNQAGAGKEVHLSRIRPIREKFTSKILLGAYLRHQISIGLAKATYCREKSKLIPANVMHWFPKSSSGMKNFFWSGLFLPKNILLICFIRLVIRTTWNKDVIATFTRNNLPEQLPKGSFELCGFKAKVKKSTTPVIIEPHEKEIRDVISLLIQHHNNMVSMGLNPESIWDTPDSKKLNFLSGTIIDRLRAHYTLPYFRMELLAKHQINLRKGIDGSLANSQRERNHATSKVTSGYLTHPIAVIEYEANNADFQRKFETTVQFRHKEASIEKYGLDRGNIDEDLIVAPADHKEELPNWFVLADGSTCTDIFAPIDKSKQDSICKGRKCHSGEGCKFNRVELGVDEFVITLRHQAYYIARGEELLTKHGQEYFDEYIAPDMRFTFGLVKYVELTNYPMFKEAKGRLESVQ